MLELTLIISLIDVDSSQSTIVTQLIKKPTAQDKQLMMDAAIDFITLDLRPLFGIEGKGLRKVVQAGIQIGAKLGKNFDANEIIPTRNAVRENRKL